MNSKPILFIDFDGTLCHQRYWRSLPEKEYEKIQELFFREDRTIINEWMRGKYSAEEINKIAAEKIGVPFEKLWKLFVKDCSTMKVSLNVLEEISKLKAKYRVILVTGNMDSFSRFTSPALHLENYFDHISNSFYEGKHKTDNGGEIFVEYANKYGVSLKDCSLIDDSPKVCGIFKTFGGTIYQITPTKDIEYYLKSLI